MRYNINDFVQAEPSREDLLFNASTVVECVYDLGELRQHGGNSILVSSPLSETLTPTAWESS